MNNLRRPMTGNKIKIVTNKKASNKEKPSTGNIYC
jgi:hypothetical protein